MRPALLQLRAALAEAGLDPGPDVSIRRIPLGIPSADAILRGGLQQGALHEVFSAPGHEVAGVGFAIAIALRLCGPKPLLWIRQDFSALEYGEIAAEGFAEWGGDPARLFCLCVSDAADAVRAAGDALAAPALGAVLIETIGETKALDLATSRRLTLAAAKQGVATILLRFAATPQTSAAETRWLVRAASSSSNEDWGDPVFDIDLVRHRHGSTGHWVMEWNANDGVFRGRTADCGAVVSTALDRPAATAMETVRLPAIA